MASRFSTASHSSISKTVQCGSSGNTGRADWTQLFGSLISQGYFKIPYAGAGVDTTEHAPC